MTHPLSPSRTETLRAVIAKIVAATTDDDGGRPCTSPDQDGGETDSGYPICSCGWLDRDHDIRRWTDELESLLAGLQASPGLTFDVLRAINKLRCETAFHKVEAWKPWEWSNAMAGECGEACNITKKMNRVWPANEFIKNWNKPEDQRLEELAEKLADEIADVVIYADLLATAIGRSLGECIVRKFNEKSDEIGSAVKLPASPSTSTSTEEPQISFSNVTNVTSAWSPIQPMPSGMAAQMSKAITFTLADPQKSSAIELLKRIAGWDMLDATSDGPYWKAEIAKVLATPTSPSASPEEPIGEK